MKRLTLAAALAALCAPAFGAPAVADYAFVAPPQINVNRLYRIDTRTGEVTACEFALTPGKPTLAPGAFGVTVCARAGEGATAGPIGHYGLVASHHEQEAGVFRVDYVTGAVSNCYVYSKMDKQGDHQVIVDRYVVCTPMTK